MDAPHGSHRDVTQRSVARGARWLLGFALVYGLSQVRFELTSTGQEISGLPIAWSLLHYVIASAFALASAAVAGYLPARRAARLNPVDIIRGAS